MHNQRRRFPFPHPKDKRRIAKNLTKIGRYEVTRPVRLCHGGSVIPARDPFGRIVALEILSPSPSHDDRRLIRFYQEAKLAMTLDHPNLVRVNEVGEDGGLHFIAMDFVAGESLYDCIRRNGPFDERYAIRAILAVAEALVALHGAGLVHRDVNPRNVLLTRDGGVKLLNLGLVKDLEVDRGLTMPRSGLGAPDYVAPEQFRGAKYCGAAADIYGLGATLYTAVTGRVPFPGGSIVDKLKRKLRNQYVPPETIAQHLGPGVIHAIRWAMTAEPTARQKNVGELVASLSPKGQTVGDFKLLEQISHGSSGPVFRASAGDGKVVAIKLLDARAAQDQRVLVRFYQEAKLSMQIEHPNLLRTLEVGQHDGRHFIAMEYCRGESLARHVKRKGRLSEAEALEFVADVAAAVHAAHRQKVVHRNINPSNILITRQGRAKLADLGLAKSLSANLDLTQTGKGLGTPPFMAPEQFCDAKNVGRRADVYALGATLYAILTGRLPFGGGSIVDQFRAKSGNDLTPPEAYNRAISRETALLIKQALDVSPSNRPASALAFRRKALAALQSLERRSSGRERGKHSRKRPAVSQSIHRSLLAAPLSAACALLACLRSFLP